MTNLAHLPMRFMVVEVQRQQQALDELRQRYALEASYALMIGDFANLSGPQWEARHREIRYADERVHRLRTEPWRRWANGFSCLFFVMVGVPLAIRMRNSDLWTTFAVVFLPILLVYYPMLVLGVDYAKTGDLPPYSVWTGNLVLGAIGIYLMRKIIRY